MSYSNSQMYCECLHIREQLWNQFHKLTLCKSPHIIEFEGFKYEVDFFNKEGMFNGTFEAGNHLQQQMIDDGLFEYDP